MLTILVASILCYVSKSLGPRVYSTGLKSLSLGLSVEINIIVGYGNNSVTKDGVNVTFTSSTSNSWLGIGFASNMANAPALICANGYQSPEERQLGTPQSNPPGTLFMNQIGTGSCNVTTSPKLIWSMNGYDYQGIYTFNIDGSDISLIYAHGDGSTSFGYHGSNRGKQTIGLTCMGDCDPDPTTTVMTTSAAASTTLMTTSAMTATSETTTTTALSSTGRTYTGTTVLNNANELTVKITINVGYLATDSVTNGVELVLTNNLMTYSYWMGIGINSMSMAGTSAIICSDTLGVTKERILGTPGTSTAAGNQISSVGNGTCDINTNGKMRWSVSLDNNQFVFPENGDNLNVIWAYGSSTVFGYHGSNNRGSAVVTFKCTGNCDGTPSYATKHSVWMGIFITIIFILF